jgi:hypothetical protein
LGALPVAVPQEGQVLQREQPVEKVVEVAEVVAVDHFLPHSDYLVQMAFLF